MSKRKILFVCVHNSARSVMAEAFMNSLCGDQFVAESAGLEIGQPNSLVAQVMAEIGLDISMHKPRAITDIIVSRHQFSDVITVCDESGAQRCPIVPGTAERLHWSFPDPSALIGTTEERLEATRQIRDMIFRQIEQYCASVCPHGDN